MQAAWISPKSSDDVCLQHFLAAHGVDLIFDVGANKGQYAEKVFAHGYGRADRLLRAALRAARRARGEEPQTPGVGGGRALLHRRPDGRDRGEHFRELDRELDPAALGRTPPGVPGRGLRGHREGAHVPAPLDERFDRHLGEATRPFLKIDVQGFESEVLDGARRSIPHLVGMQVELSLVDCYEGQKGSFSQMIRRIEEMGFELIRFFPSFIDTATGRWLQADGLFFRSG